MCGQIRYGSVQGGPSLPQAYAGYSGMRGIGDSPEWADAYGSYAPGKMSVGGDILSTFRDHPWVALLLAAGVGFGIAAVGRIR